MLKMSYWSTKLWDIQVCFELLSHTCFETEFLITHRLFRLVSRLLSVQYLVDYMKVSATFHRASFSCFLHKTIEKKAWNFKKSAFDFVFKWCTLRNAVDLIDFMLRRVLCIAFVTMMCCQSATPPRMRDALTWGRF